MFSVIRILKELNQHKPHVIVHSYSTLDIDGLIIPFEQNHVCSYSQIHRVLSLCSYSCTL